MTVQAFQAPPFYDAARSGDVVSDMTSEVGERGYQRLAEQIMQLILGGEFAPGARLPSERNLADRFQVSRTAVREAVIALEVQETVEVRLGSGIYVRERPATVKAIYVPSGPGPFELLRARRLIEGEIAAQAAEMRRDADIDRIYAALADMRDKCDDKHANEVADLQFHIRIAEATGNAVLAHVVQALWEQLRGPIWAQLEQHFHTPELRQASLEDHQKIFAAIASQNAVTARAAMHEHIDRVVGEFVKGWA